MRMMEEKKVFSLFSKSRRTSCLSETKSLAWSVLSQSSFVSQPSFYIKVSTLFVVQNERHENTPKFIKLHQTSTQKDHLII